MRWEVESANENLSEKVRECRRNAEDCGHQAKVLADPKRRQNLLNSEQRWLTLAENYEFAGRLTQNLPNPK
jgi:hypothetical protein